MDIDDILAQLDDGETDADLAMAVGLGTRHISTIDTSRLPGVAKEMASTTSGFRLIPDELLYPEILIDGMRHMNAKEAEVHASPDYRENYRQAAIARLERGDLFLFAFNYALIDKRMVLATLRHSSFGDDKAIERASASAIDDEVALASLAKNNKTVIFAHPAAAKFEPATWLAAVSQDDAFVAQMLGHKLGEMLGSFMTNGYWPKNVAGEKPEDVKAAVAERAKQKDASSVRSFVLNTLIKTYPIEEVLPCLKSPARAKIRSQIYSLDDLRPHMKAYPFLKASVLENDLGV